MGKLVNLLLKISNLNVMYRLKTENGEVPTKKYAVVP